MQGECKMQLPLEMEMLTVFLLWHSPSPSIIHSPSCRLSPILALNVVFAIFLLLTT